MAHGVLITGARGYLGGRLVQGLSADPAFRVRGSSRNASGKPEGWPATAELVRLDPLGQGERALAEALAGIQTVVHLAAASADDSKAHPEETVRAAVAGCRNLLRAAREAGAQRFIFLSTIHVYGTPLEGRITEETPTAAAHPYAAAHLAAEEAVREAHASGEIEGVVLRLSNGIGAPAWADMERWELIGNDLCRQAVTSRRIVLKSNGLQRRDFILLSDFVRAIRHTIMLPKMALGEGLFNLGGRLPLRMIDVADAVSRRAGAMLGHDVPVEELARRLDTPPIDYVIDRIAATGFAPSPSAALDAEIDATLALCRAASAKRAAP